MAANEKEMLMKADQDVYKRQEQPVYSLDGDSAERDFVC